MFLHFSGLSLIIHLLVIALATIFNFIRGEKHKSAFQTYNCSGGMTIHSVLDRVISVTILLFICTYILSLFILAVSTGIEVGASEPQIIFVKWLASLIFSGVLFVLLSATFQVILAIGIFAGLVILLRMRRLEVINLFSRIRIKFIDLKYLRVSLQYVGLFVSKFISLLVFTLYTLNSFYLLLGILVGISLFTSPIIASAQIVEPGFESEVVASGFSLGTAVAFLPDGRILVTEKSGVVKVIKNGVVLSEPLVTLTDVNTFGDRGLLGIAVDPNFENNGYIYLSYTYENSPGVNIAGSKTGRIVRLTVVGDIASESTKLVLLGTVGGSALSPSCENFAVTDDCIPSDSNSHSVGGLRFGPDGKLYATMGDGADFSAVDLRALRAQNIDSLAGKMIRINTDGTAPADNPFYDGNPNSNRSKVFALGFRNMFRFSFNQQNGKIYGGDVGWSSWEEINQITAGANYGWPCREGSVATTYECTPSTTATDPIYTYPHNAFGAGSITGGAFFSNNAYPSSYENSILIGDYAQMWLKRLVLDSDGAVVSVQDFTSSAVFPVEIIAGLDGNIYYLDILKGDLNRITHTNGNRRPIVQMTVDSSSGLLPLAVNFSTAGTVDPDGNPISYFWNFGDGATSTEANPSHTYTQNGSYQASVVVTDSLGSAAAKSITITAGNQAPDATIISPANGSFYRALENVTVTGVAQDLEDGVLSASAFDWTVLLHHNIHVHTVQQFSDTKRITFVADDHLDSDVYMEIILTVTDSTGLVSSESINMYLNNGTAVGNLVVNPSLENEDPILQDTPEGWVIGWYGQLDPIFSYPVQGLSGNKAAQVQIISYTSGNAKWYFTPAFVTAGASYNFSNLYKANTQSFLTAQYGRADGTYFYQVLEILPPTADPTTTNVDFVIPADAETMTIFHEIASVGTLIVDEYSLVLKGSDDTTPPTGSITSPSDGDSVSGVVTVEVDAYDVSGVTMVHLYVNGVKVEGIEDMSEPFSLVWDTTTVPDGVYELRAHMHDTPNNHGLSEPISVTVNNSIGSSTNLIYNGDFDLVDGLNNPLGWTRGGWGTNTRVHTYPVVGVDGGPAAQVQITNYDFDDTGDAKWHHADVPVTPGVQYRYETHYKATSISDVIGRYTFTNGSYHYFGLIKEIPGVADWTPISNTFIPPQDAVSVTFFHLISSESTLAIDKVGMFAVSTGTPSEINPPLVSFIAPLNGSTISGVTTLRASSTDDTAVVGVYFAVNGSPYGAEDNVAPYEIDLDTTTLPNGTYVLKATSHDPFGNNDKAEITVTIDNSIVVPPTGNNLILNPELEDIGTNGDPSNWKRGGWGTNDRTLTYPVPGVTGNAARVAITSYTNGDVKWYFDDVNVTPGDVYTFSRSYKSTSPTNLTIRYTRPDGTYLYTGMGNPSASPAWQNGTSTITVPAGVSKMTVMHILNQVGVLEVDNYYLVNQNGTSTTTDTTNPTISLTAPVASSTVSGIVNITANASDPGSGLSNVQIFIDNTSVASLGATGPFNYAWDTSTVSNGDHTIHARATDVAGNSAQTNPIIVTVNNGTTTPPTGNNLILNHDFEVVGVTGDPANWKRGGWGINDRTFTYPVAGQTGNGARVSMTTYTSGDAKWYFDDVNVTPGEQYTFSYAYKANVTSNITLRYTRTDGTYLYVGTGNPAASANWTNASFSITPPAGVTALTIMHILNQVGVLEIDNQSLSTGNSNTFTRGKVSLSFDDGWIEHATVAAPILDAANIDGTFYIISNEMLDAMPTERLQNPTLDTVGTGGNPANWNRGGWGTNDRTFTYPVAGVNDSAAQVTVSNYTNGDAKWYFDDVSVLQDFTYTAKSRYQSNASTEVLIRHRLTDGTYVYQFLGSLPASGLGNWATYEYTFFTPVNATSLTIFHVLAQNGTLITDELSVMQEKIYADTNQVLAMQAAGHEIGSHTKTHPSLITLNTSEKTDEIAGSKADLEAVGLDIKSIAYPYGSYDASVSSITSAAGYLMGRTVDRGFNDQATDPFGLRIQQVGRNTNLAQLQSWIDQAAQNDTWLILMFHQIGNDLTEELGITESDFAQLVDYVVAADVDVITVAEGATLLNN